MGSLIEACICGVSGAVWVMIVRSEPGAKGARFCFGTTLCFSLRLVLRYAIVCFLFKLNKAELAAPVLSCISRLLTACRVSACQWSTQTAA